MQIGQRNQIKTKVTENDTAKVFGSGELLVLATPRMIALMEECSYKCISKDLEAGSSSVGTLLNVKHLSATPVGMEITVEAEITEIDGRRVCFSIKAYDECGLIGEGTHERFIVFSDKFMQKTYSKLESK
ncbi:MAG: thioesterase family protein [Clostridia bacterium]|nr:thioesterase family protein [Clostridia bacterium]